MNIKKIVSSVLAAVCAAVMLAVPACADAIASDATFCFDTPDGLSKWDTFGSVKETGFAYSSSSMLSESGEGSLCITEKIITGIDESARFGGAYVTAEALGLENFDGCTVQMSFLFDGNVSEIADSFTIFSDGGVRVTSVVSAESSGRWSKISLSVPENVNNDKIGFDIPVFERYVGNVVYVDNVIIYTPDGKIVKNVGDHRATATRIEVSIGLVGRIALIALIIVILILVIIGIKSIVKSFKEKFI